MHSDDEKTESLIYILLRHLDVKQDTVLDPAMSEDYLLILMKDGKADATIYLDMIHESWGENDQRILDPTTETAQQLDMDVAVPGTFRVVYEIVRKVLKCVPLNCDKRTYAIHVLRRYAQVLMSAINHWQTTTQRFIERGRFRERWPHNPQKEEYFKNLTLHFIYRSEQFLQRCIANKILYNTSSDCRVFEMVKIYLMSNGHRNPNLTLCNKPKVPTELLQIK